MNQPPPYNDVIGFNNIQNNAIYNTNAQHVPKQIRPNLANLQTRMKVKKEDYRQFLHIRDFRTIPIQYRKDIKDYGKRLGVNLRKNPTLLRYVISSILEVVPENWTENLDQHGIIYYRNTSLNEIQWDHPLDEYYRYKIKEVLKEKSCW